MCCVGNVEHHLIIVEEVLNKQESSELRGKREKCIVLQNTIESLGYKISGHGIKVPEMCLIGLETMKRPKNIYQLRRSLGSFNYFSRFIPNYAF
jgi:hypothetical protein